MCTAGGREGEGHIMSSPFIIPRVPLAPLVHLVLLVHLDFL